jgi:dUTPase
MIINQYEHVEIQQVSELPESARGEGGFGSTGVKKAG